MIVFIEISHILSIKKTIIDMLKRVILFGYFLQTKNNILGLIQKNIVT